MRRRLILIALAAFIAGCNAATPTPRANVPLAAASATKDGIPTQLGAFALMQTKSDAAALADFAQMHGKGFELVGGYVAYYAGAGKESTLWVAQAKDASAASAMVEQMAQKIAAGNPVFANPQSLNISGRVIYQVDGMGQTHFYYAVNDKIVWIAVDAEQSFEGLHALWSAVK